MTEKQALTLITLVQQEAPQIQARLSRSKQTENDYGFVVKMTLRQRTLTAYQYDDWQSIKEAWCWFLPGMEPAQEEAPTLYLVNGTPMVLDYYHGYWYGRYQEGGKTKRKYLGRLDPRSVLSVYRKEEEAVS